MSNAANAALAEPWKDLWNGDLSLTDTIIAEDFTAHAGDSRPRVTRRTARWRRIVLRVVDGTGAGRRAGSGTG
jgi:hypothetical protein